MENRDTERRGHVVTPKKETRSDSQCGQLQSGRTVDLSKKNLRKKQNRLCSLFSSENGWTTQKRKHLIPGYESKSCVPSTFTATSVTKEDTQTSIHNAERHPPDDVPNMRYCMSCRIPLAHKSSVKGGLVNTEHVQCCPRVS